MTNEEKVNGFDESEVPAFDMDEWIALKRAEREQAYDMIDQMSELVTRDGECFKNCLDLIGRFGKYSPSNILLLAAQKPDAKKLMDAKGWKEARAYIRKGESGIILLEAGNTVKGKDGKTFVRFHAKKIFDVSQTTAPFKEEPIRRMDTKLLLAALIHNAPCQFEFADASAMPQGVIAHFSEEDNTVYVKRGAEEDVTFRGIAKELAAAHLIKAGCDPALSDFAAQSVAYILSQRNGVSTVFYDFTRMPESVESLDEAGIKKLIGQIREVSNSITNEEERFFEQRREERVRDSARAGERW